MRIFQAAAFCTAIAFTGTAQAQDLTVSGASAAGLCASALEFVAGARASAGQATPTELLQLQQARDLILRLPQYPRGQVAAYAEAWSERMIENLTQAPNKAQRKVVADDIAGRARNCHQGMLQALAAANAQRGVVQNPAPIVPTQPIVPAQ